MIMKEFEKVHLKSMKSFKFEKVHLQSLCNYLLLEAKDFIVNITSNEDGKEIILRIESKENSEDNGFVEIAIPKEYAKGLIQKFIDGSSGLEVTKSPTMCFSQEEIDIVDMNSFGRGKSYKKDMEYREDLKEYVKERRITLNQKQ